MDREQEIAKYWKYYLNGIAYQNSIGLRDKIAKYIKYYEGEQWAEATERTKNLPRPVFNIIKMICRSKKSSILNNEAKIVYKTYDDINVDKFNHYAMYQQHSMNNEKKNAKATFDAVRKGNWIKHYYWDKEMRGTNGKVVGALDCEVIDPLSIFVANPVEHDPQKQEYIVIAKREPVSSVKAKCEKKTERDKIVSDDAESNSYGVKEQDDNKLVTVLTTYFRKDSEVYCCITTKSAMVKEPFSLTPDLNKALEYLHSDDEKVEDAPNNNIADAPRDDVVINQETKCFLYPIAWESYEEREGSIYGIGEIEGIESNQKAINFTFGMALLNIQDNAWGKYVVLPNALKQKITNTPGEVLTDYSGTGNGIKKLSEQVIQSQPIQIVDKMVEITRSLTGATEVLNGEVLGKNMSGTAIASLQNQAQAPIVELRDSFWRFLEQEGKILAQFYKLYYTDQEYFYEDSQNKQKVKDTFSSNEFKNTDFEVAVEVISGSKASTLADVGMLDNLLQSGVIDARTYISMYPNDAISNKNELLQSIDSQQNNIVGQMQQQIDQLNGQIEQVVSVLEQQQEIIDKASNIIKENNALKQQLIELKNESTVAINSANEQILAGNDMIERLTRDDKGKALFESLQDNKAMADFINKNKQINNNAS